MNPTSSTPLQSLLAQSLHTQPLGAQALGAQSFSAQALRAQGNLWRAADLPAEQPEYPALCTGCPTLDRLLPDGGWPRADLVELLCNVQGIGELRLLMPILAQLSHEQRRWIAWIAPPHIPYAPALAAYGIDINRILLIHPRTARNALWALEQALKTGTCSAVLGWPGDELRHQDIRRLQVAARQGGTLGLLFRSERVALEASPAPFRLVIRPGASLPASISDSSTSDANTSDASSAAPSTPDVITEASAPLQVAPLQVKLLKRRGGWATDFMAVRTATSSLANSPPSADPGAPTLQGFQQQLSLWRQAWRQERRAQPLPADRHKPRCTPGLASGLGSANHHEPAGWQETPAEMLR